MKKSEVRKEAILDASFDLFFEKGYDATTVRMIMRQVGCEIGLFYYYFENKDDLFQAVLDRFFDNYKKDFAALTQQAHRDPFRAMNSFFEYMRTETIRFRAKYAENIHRTIRWSIREQTLVIIEPYLREILEILISYGARPMLELNVLSAMLAHGVGSFILHEDSERMSEIHPEVKKGVNLMMGLDLETADLMFPFFAEERDIPAIVALTFARKDSLQGLLSEDKEQFTKQIARQVEAQEIFVIRHEEIAVGYIAFSKEENTITCQVTEQKYEHRGIATRLFITAMAQFRLGTLLTMTTLREGDEAGAKAQRFYRRFGFREVYEVQINGYPCQQQTMTIAERPARKQERRE